MLPELQILGYEGAYQVGVQAVDIPAMLRLLERMTSQETRYLRTHPNIPHPYEVPGLEYQTEGINPATGLPFEIWQRIRTTLRWRWKNGQFRRWGDCEDLCIFLAAWYRARLGVWAKVGVLEFRRGRRVWYHAVVVMPDGTIKDPSKVLGMRG